ncbi:MAG: hypothetical protein IT330_10170 [Anaerolineae bacterium]|nr:hypothetical protein [Anaerolineae bacterium]
MLFYGYATGTFNSRKQGRKGHPYRTRYLRVVALPIGSEGLHPDHDTLANFRKTLGAESKELFVQVLGLAQAAGYVLLDSPPKRDLRKPLRNFRYSTSLV